MPVMQPPLLLVAACCPAHLVLQVMGAMCAEVVRCSFAFGLSCTHHSSWWLPAPVLQVMGDMRAEPAWCSFLPGLSCTHYCCLLLFFPVLQVMEIFCAELVWCSFVLGLHSQLLLMAVCSFPAGYGCMCAVRLSRVAVCMAPAWRAPTTPA